jgi:hypothetical protein
LDGVGCVSPLRPGEVLKRDVIDNDMIVSQLERAEKMLSDLWNPESLMEE